MAFTVAEDRECSLSTLSTLLTFDPGSDSLLNSTYLDSSKFNDSLSIAIFVYAGVWQQLEATTTREVNIICLKWLVVCGALRYALHLQGSEAVTAALFFLHIAHI
jgi:hypothetical protein